jgi:hypothetical protein
MKLKKIALFTVNSKVIGSVESNITTSITTGTNINGIIYGEKGMLNMIGEPHGSKVYLFDFNESGTLEFKNPKRYQLNNFQIHYSDILCIHDFIPLKESSESFEKKQTEKQYELSEIVVRFNDNGEMIKGSTYIGKSANENGIIKIFQRNPGWFILQKPKRVGNISKYWFFDDIKSLKNLSNLDVDTLIINLNRVSISIV